VNGPEKTMATSLFGAIPFSIVFSITPVGGTMPRSRQVSRAWVAGRLATYDSTNGLMASSVKLPTKKNVKLLASAKRAL
jgi:hypothetical protein